MGNPDSSRKCLIEVRLRGRVECLRAIMVDSIEGLISSYLLPAIIWLVSPSLLRCLVESAQVISDEFGGVHLDVALIEGLFLGPFLGYCTFRRYYIDVLVALSFYSEGVASAYEGSLIVDVALFLR